MKKELIKPLIINVLKESTCVLFSLLFCFCLDLACKLYPLLFLCPLSTCPARLYSLVMMVGDDIILAFRWKKDIRQVENYLQILLPCCRYNKLHDTSICFINHPPQLQYSTIVYLMISCLLCEDFAITL